MDSQINQFGLNAAMSDSSFDMSSSDFTALTDDIHGPLNSASDALLEAVEPLRSCSETEPLLAPLDDILKDIYDIKSSLSSSPSGAYPMASSLSHTVLPSFNSPINNLSYGNYMNNESPYDMPCSSYGMNYLSTSAHHYMTSPAMQQMPAPVVNNSAVENAPEEDNDPSPVYLNFNIDSMAPPTVTNFSKIASQMDVGVMNFDKPCVSDSSYKYMEYLNENAETAKTRYLDSSVKSFREHGTSRQNAMNALNLSKPIENNRGIEEGEPNNEGCSKYLYSNNVHVVDSNIKAETMYQSNCYFIKKSENTTPTYEIEWTRVTPKAQPSASTEMLVCRPPLQTKRTVRENPQVSVQYHTSDGSINQVFDLQYITMLDNSDVQIPTIATQTKTERTRRKQELKIRDWEDSVSFEETKSTKIVDDSNDKEKVMSPSSFQTPKKRKEAGLSEEMFVGKRKKKNSTPPDDTLNWMNDDPDYKPFTGVLLPGRRKSKTNTQRSRDSYKTRNSERSKKVHDNDSAQGSSNEILVSSDSDLEDVSPLASKSLKCLKCKKIFKTSRSLTIHQKRCDVPVETESDLEITMVEYLESEKEFDEADEISFGDTTAGTSTVTVIEKVESDEEKVEEVVPKEEMPESPKAVEILENPLRRNTRSQTNLNASKKSSQNNEKNCEVKQGNNQIKTKARNASNNAKNTRRRKK